jgi:hypothetical protein
MLAADHDREGPCSGLLYGVGDVREGRIHIETNERYVAPIGEGQLCQIGLQLRAVALEHVGDCADAVRRCGSSAAVALGEIQARADDDGSRLDARIIAGRKEGLGRWDEVDSGQETISSMKRGSAKAA